METVTSIGVSVFFSRVRLRPSEMLLSLFVADSMAMPLTVAFAFSAYWLSPICEFAAPVLPSKFRAESPAAGSPSSVVSVALIVNPLAAPVVVERSDRREPFASVMMDADTPALAALILSRMADSEVSPAPMAMLTGALLALAKLTLGGVALSEL